MCTCCWCNRKWERPSRLLLGTNVLWRSSPSGAERILVPHQKKRTKEINKGSMVNNWTYRFFFVCVSIFSSYHLAIISISSFQSLRLWYEIDTANTSRLGWTFFFYHENVCVCVCMCVTISSYDHPILHFSPFISMYDMIWLEVLFVCVCRIRKEKNQLRETLSEYTVRGGG